MSSGEDIKHKGKTGITKQLAVHSHLSQAELHWAFATARRANA